MSQKRFLEIPNVKSIMNWKLKIAILKSGKPQYEIAQEARIGYNRLSGIVHGYIKPKHVEKYKLAKVLGYEISGIFDE